MAVRIRQLDAYTLYPTNAAASGEDWATTLGEFKAVQRALNANYPKITQQRLIVDGRLGANTVREAQRFGKVDLQWLADNARAVATDIAETAGVKPNFSPSVLLTDYRGEPEPGTAPSPSPLPPQPTFEPEPEPEDFEPEPEPDAFEPEPADFEPAPSPPAPKPSAPPPPEGRSAIVWVAGAVAVGLVGYGLWRWRRRSR